jgi:tight adherence protein C
VPREGALKALALRAPLPAVQALIAAIGRSERHGAPLSDGLRALAAQARADQGRALTEQAAKAAPKIQLVVALLLVPAAMLVVAAGAVAGLTG